MRTESRVAVMSIFLGMLLVTGCTLKGEEELLVTVSPGSAVVTLGDTKQFSVDPAGTTVTWSVKDILGGTEGTVVGAIDTNGKYTSPSDAAVAPEKVIIRAAEASGSTGSAIAFLTTFKENEQITAYTTGTPRTNTFSAGQHSIAVYKDEDTGETSVYVVWSDNSTGVYTVWFSKSADGGDSFVAPIPIDDTSTGQQLSPSIAVDENGTVFVVWEDYNEGDADIRLKKYDGTNFGDVTKVNLSLDSDVVGYDTSPAIATASGEIYVAWEHKDDVYNDYPDIYFARSTNQGVTFPTPAEIATSGRRLAIAMDATGVAYVAWEDLTQFPDEPTHIKMTTVEAGTPTGEIDIPVVAGDYHARYPSIAVDPVCNNTITSACTVYIVWQRAEIPEPKFENEFIKSYDIDLATVETVDGTTWEVSATLSIPDSSNVSLIGGSAYPTIAADDSYIYVAWDDQRNGSKDIYFAKSSDGAIFTTNRIVNDGAGDESTEVTWHEKPAIAVSDEKAYVIWTDYRNTQISTTAAPNDVFFAVEK